MNVGYLEYNRMRELNVNEIQEVNGGILNEAGYLEDALVIGGATLAGGASAAITAPMLVIAAAVAAAYYSGKWIGGRISIGLGGRWSSGHAPVSRH